MQTPYYLYEQNKILAACDTLQSHLPGFTFLYSVKANPFPPILQTVAGEGFGADAASKEEVLQSLAAGIPAAKIYYSTPGRRKTDLEETWGKCVFIADSLHEIQMAQEVAKEKNQITEIGLRIHPMFAMGEKVRASSKFGIDAEHVAELAELFANCPNLKVTGFHFHLQSQVLDAEVLGKYYQDAMDTAVQLGQTLQAEVKFINFGSGIGIPYDTAKDQPINLDRLQALTEDLRQKNEKTLQAELIIETGRFVVARAGTYVTEVLDKKVSDGTTYLIVANGLNGFLRSSIVSMIDKLVDAANVPGMEPLFTTKDAFHIRVRNDSKEMETVTVVGNLCTSLDVIKENVTLPKAEIGDRIEIDNAGSYGYSLSPIHFASHQPPKQYFCSTEGEQPCD